MNLQSFSLPRIKRWSESNTFLLLLNCITQTDDIIIWSQITVTSSVKCLERRRAVRFRTALHLSAGKFIYQVWNIMKSLVNTCQENVKTDKYTHVFLTCQRIYSLEDAQSKSLFCSLMSRFVQYHSDFSSLQTSLLQISLLFKRSNAVTLQSSTWSDRLIVWDLTSWAIL